MADIKGTPKEAADRPNSDNHLRPFKYPEYGCVMELGGIFSTLLFGITTVQTFNYYRDYPRDVVILRTVVRGRPTHSVSALTEHYKVGSIWLFELVHTILVWHGIYSMTVTFYGQPEHLADPPPTLALTLVSETIIVAVVQIYFINRIRLVAKKWFLPALCLILTLLRFGACVAMLAVVLINANLFILSERFRWLIFVLSSLASPGLAISQNKKDGGQTYYLVHWFVLWPPSYYFIY
ncbi:hypothetical protein DFH08DRAFT_820311 [Mycena albidolilacea]|uniref:Uncharacterized protein n=1 Tax=Mycena albidolilacea TaxID=1033008 RepID=A0AAD6ZD15_9AGAR|nr:hypothetical protein DFH08DRAFT_820311 [Mycena albidolilacea]